MLSSVFYEEVLDLIRERVAKVPKIADVQVDNIALEISGSRSAHYMSPRDTANCLIKSIIASADMKQDSKEIGAYLKKVFAKLSSVVRNYVKTKEDQVTAINTIEASMIEFPATLPSLQVLLHYLYELDPSVLEEDAILAW